MNRAIKIAKGEWIARMDADDLMLPNRIEEQMNYLSEHPEIDVISCWAYYINEKGQPIGELVHPNDLSTQADNERYLTNGQITPLLHPSVIMRKSTILDAGGYKPIAPGQDMELWGRLQERRAYIVCMKKILMKYRIHKDSITSSDYMKSLDYYDWIVACMSLRRSQKPEISFENFKETLRGKSMIIRLNRWRKNYSNYLYREASFAFGNHKYFHFMLYVFFSSLLEPKKITRLIALIQRRLSLN